MADIKVLYVNSDGLYQEHSEASDSIRLLSLKTTNYELTDTKLGNLIDGADAADQHIHDGRYFRENEHISTSAGVADAGKPVVLDASGKFDASLINFGAIDHGGLSGLADDDHLQYIRVDGTRDFTGVQSYSSHPTFNDDLQLVDKKYVDDVLLTSEWYPYSALDYVVDNTLAPATEVTGDVYVLSHDGGSPNAAWDGASAGDIVRFDGTVWVATTPTAGTRIGVDDEASVAFYLFGGTTWSPKYEESTTASNGLTKVAFDIRLADANTGGVNIASGVVSVNVDNLSIEKGAGAGNPLQVKADGINDTHIDWGTGANQVSAVDMPIADAGGYFTTDNVEFALQKLAADVLNRGTIYTAGVGGVSKGDLLYVSANNTVLPLTTITQNEYCVGLALEDAIATADVKVLANDVIITGVLTGATAGDVVYWNGSGPVFTAPTGAGGNVWQIGVAKNATDLHVEIRQVKKNA